MTDRKAISCVADLADLDDAEILEGYADGRRNEATPGGNRSLSYWHGWRNGRVDGGHAENDAAQLKLCRDYVRG